jgi:hypothetical protein
MVHGQILFLYRVLLLLLWRCSPYGALASSMRCFQDSLSLCLVSQARMPSNMTSSSLTFFSLQFPGCVAAVCCSAFFGIQCFSILITCPAPCNLLNLINYVTFISLCKSQISSVYLTFHPFSSRVGPKIRLEIFLSNTFNISSTLLVMVQVCNRLVLVQFAVNFMLNLL